MIDEGTDLEYYFVDDILNLLLGGQDVGVTLVENGQGTAAEELTASSSQLNL